MAVDEVGFFPPSTVLFLDAVAGTTYHVAISGKDRGGEPLEGLDFGSTSLVISAPEPPLFTALETLLPQGSDWHYLLLTQGNGDDPPLMNEPIDPRDIDPDFDQTWHTEEGYDGPAFLGPSPALLGYGVVNATQVVTDIWGGRDADGDPSTNDTAPPSGLRHAAYFRTTFTPASNVQHLGFRGIIDDGAEIFVNGERVLNINYWGPEGAWDGAAGPSNGTEDELQESVAIGVNLQAGLVVELAVAVHNSLATSSDMGFDLEVYSIADPGSDVGKKLITGEPLVARFDSATAGAMSGLGDGGIDDSLPWLSSSATVEAESTLPNPPTGGSAGKVLYASMKAVGFVSGAIDLRGVDNSQVVATVDFRTFESSSTSDFEAADWIEAYVEASLDTITYYRVADLIPLRSGSNQESPDELKPLELPGAAFNTFHTTPGDIPAAARSLRIVVSGELKGSVSEHFFIDNVSVGTDLASPPPVRASISRDPSTGANTITWNSDGASTYRVFFGTDLAGLTQIHSGSGNDSFTHTPPAIDPQGFYFVLRSSSAPAPD